MNKSKDKKSRYDHYMRLWYMICPLLTVVFLVMEWNVVLRGYQLLLGLFAAACICSEIYHGGDWWDRQSTKLQKETRTETKTRYGSRYVRPILVGLPAILVFVILEIPAMIRWIG